MVREPGRSVTKGNSLSLPVSRSQPPPRRPEPRRVSDVVGASVTTLAPTPSGFHVLPEPTRSPDLSGVVAAISLSRTTRSNNSMGDLIR